MAHSIRRTFNWLSGLQIETSGGLITATTGCLVGLQAWKLIEKLDVVTFPGHFLIAHRMMVYLIESAVTYEHTYALLELLPFSLAVQ